MPKETVKLYGKVEKGKLTFTRPDLVSYQISIINGPVEMTIKEKRATRSLRQNAYYWGVVIPILGGYFGYDAEEMHEALKFHFLRVHTNILPTVRSTASLNISEFIEYIDKVIHWAATEFSITIPLPDESYLQSASKDEEEAQELSSPATRTKS